MTLTEARKARNKSLLKEDEQQLTVLDIDPITDTDEYKKLEKEIKKELGLTDTVRLRQAILAASPEIQSALKKHLLGEISELFPEH